jgi:hypothetical protein
LQSRVGVSGAFIEGFKFGRGDRSFGWLYSLGWLGPGGWLGRECCDCLSIARALALISFAPNSPR